MTATNIIEMTTFTGCSFGTYFGPTTYRPHGVFSFTSVQTTGRKVEDVRIRDWVVIHDKFTEVLSTFAFDDKYTIIGDTREGVVTIQ